MRPRRGRALAELRRAPKNRHLRSALAELVMARQAERSEEPRRPDAPDNSASGPGLPRALAQLADEHALEFPDATVGEFLDWVVAGGEGAMELEAGGRCRAVHLPPRQGPRMAGGGRRRSRGRHGPHRLRDHARGDFRGAATPLRRAHPGRGRIVVLVGPHPPGRGQDVAV